jgi:threonine dehydratase
MEPMTRGAAAEVPGADVWPITLEDVEEARSRIDPYLTATPLRHYAELDEAVGGSARVLVKHENHHPTNAFKVRNGLSALTALDSAERARGVCAATRGNHGLGLAYAGRILDVPVVVVVPRGNNPEKNAGMRALGAELLEEGDDYDEAAAAADQVARERRLTLVHSTNDRNVLAGAATLWLEVVAQASELDAVVVGVGGGSQAVGALVVLRALRPSVPVYAVQAAGAAAAHDSWHAGRVVSVERADTFADGLATRSAYAMTFPALRAGLAGFVTVTDGEIAASIRTLLRTTHNLAEGAGAVGVAGVARLREELAGRTVAVVLSGANIDAETLRRVLNDEI